MVASFDFLGEDKRFVAFPVLGYLLVDVECSETSVVIYSEAVLEVKIDIFIASADPAFFLTMCGGFAIYFAASLFTVPLRLFKAKNTPSKSHDADESPKE